MSSVHAHCDVDSEGLSARLSCLSAQLCALSGPILSVPFSRCAGGVEGLGPAGGGGAHVAEELALRGGLFGPAQNAAAAPVRRPPPAVAPRRVARRVLVGAPERERRARVRGVGRPREGRDGRRAAVDVGVLERVDDREAAVVAQDLRPVRDVPTKLLK